MTAAALLILLAAVIPVADEWARSTHTHPQPADTDTTRSTR